MEAHKNEMTIIFILANRMSRFLGNFIVFMRSFSAQYLRILACLRDFVVRFIHIPSTSGKILRSTLHQRNPSNMKASLFLILAGWAILFHQNTYGQNSDCASPSGAMQQPDSLTPTCFAGQTSANSGPLVQYYTFVATTATMAAQLSPVVSTSCSFPNTAINYSNFELFNSGDCGTLLCSSPTFSNLTVGTQYTFGLTMTPQDPACVWISQACPRVIEIVIPLGADLQYFTGLVDLDVVRLSWDVPNPNALPQEFQIFRRNSTLAPFEKIGVVNANVRTNYGYAWQDPNPVSGHIQYVLEMIDGDGQHARSEVMELEVDARHVLKLYPNPCRDRLQVAFPGVDEQVYNLCLSDLYGAAVKEMHGTAHQLNASLPEVVAKLRPGIYWLHCQDGKAQYVARFVKI
jgi:hypothetical protein